MDNKDIKIIWGSMLYRCGNCGHEKTMYLQVGVEGPKGQKEQPCPFTILCPECQKDRPYQGFPSMDHVDWHKDEHFEQRPLRPDESYFALDYEAGCGQPIMSCQAGDIK